MIRRNNNYYIIEIINKKTLSFFVIQSNLHKTRSFYVTSNNSKFNYVQIFIFIYINLLFEYKI